MTAGDLLQWISLAQKTGTLTVTAHGVEKTVYFRHGRVISSASSDPREYLGQFLMSHGYISEEELKKAMEVQNQSQILLGKILVMIKVISERDLLRLMKLKAEEGIYDVFLWKDGDFKFSDDDLPSNAMVPLNIEITGIVMEGLRRYDEWGRIRRVIADATAVPALVGSIDGQLGEPRQTIVHAVNGQRTIEQIILESRSSEFIVSKTVFDFIQEGKMRLAEPPKAKPVAVAEPAEPPVAEVQAASTDGEEIEDEVTVLLTRAQTALRANEYEKALRTLKAAQNLDPHNAKVKNSLRGAETVIVGELRKAGIVDKRVPRLAKQFDELGSMDFTPSEGFILSRINGVWDVGSILKISPMRETDALLIFHRLLRDRVITLEG